MSPSSRQWLRPRLAFGLLAIGLGTSCGSKSSGAAIGPQGGLITSDDDGLTIVLWPGALGSYETFTITPSEMPPQSFGQAYRVQPNLALAVDAEIILRGDLPNDLSRARIGSISAADIADGDDEWKTLPHRGGAIDEKESTIHSNDAELALYYAMLDDGMDSDATSTGDPTTDPTDASSTDPTGIPTTTSYARDIQMMIFNQGCIAQPMCHGTAPQGNLTLSGNASSMLIDVPANINGAYTRVICRDPDNSLLLQKLARTQPADAGLPMPPDAAAPPELLDLVRLWIDEGCPP